MSDDDSLYGSTSPLREDPATLNGEPENPHHAVSNTSETGSPFRSLGEEIEDEMDTGSPSRSFEEDIGDEMDTGSPSRSLEEDIGDTMDTGSPSRSLEEDIEDAMDTGSPTPLPGLDSHSSSPETEITANVAIRPTRTGDSGEGEDDTFKEGSTSGGLPPTPHRTPKQNLLIDLVVSEEASKNPDDETQPSPSTKDQGNGKAGVKSPLGASKNHESKAKGREEENVVDNRPNTVDEEGYAIVDPYPEEETEKAVRRANSKAGSQDLSSVGVLAPQFPPLILLPIPPPSARVIVAPAVPIPDRPDVIMEDVESDYDTEQPTTGIERPVQKIGNPKTFTIVRLIENTDKTGNSIESAIRLRQHYFDVDFGDFLLDLSGLRTDNAQVRNYAGQERYIPRRMLQNVYQPWDIPAKTRVAEDGVPFPLAFLKEGTTATADGATAFEDEEPVMIMDELNGNDNQQVLVTDWERKAGRFDLDRLDRRFEVPWGILVDGDALRAAWDKKTAPKLPKAKGQDTGKGRKRNKGEDDYNEDVDELEDDEEDDRAGEGPSKKPKVAKKSQRKKGPKKQKKSASIAEDEPMDDATAGPIETAKRKKSVGQKTAGKRPAKRSTGPKKATKARDRGALLEAVAEEEESGDEDAA